MSTDSKKVMIDAARWLARRRLLGIWRQSTWIHLIATDDFLEATRQAMGKEGISGIYHIGDEGVQTLQEFLDSMTPSDKGATDSINKVA